MKTAKRATIFLLLLSMLLSASACSDTNGENGSGNQNSAGGVEVEADADDLNDNLPDIKLDGYDFGIHCWLDRQVPTIYADSVTGNPVNDAVYDKIMAVQERFDCKISMTELGGDPNEAEALIQGPILAGDDSFDVATGHDISLANMTLEGFFLNLYDVPHLDFNKPWWPSQTVESLTLDGAMYLFSNFISYYNMSDTRVWYFNKTLFDNNGLEYPYQSVYEGTWTLDAMTELMKDTYIDLNGNGTMDMDADAFGATTGGFYSFLEPFQKEPYVHTKDGGLEYSFDVEWYSKLVDKLSKLLYGNTGRIHWQAYDAFAANRVMMYYESVNAAFATYSQTDVVYGVLPMPKFDESQDQYYGGCTDRPFVVPTTAAKHADTTGLIIEALSAEGYKKVYPAYFEVALKSRYADQTDDAKMFDIIMNNNILSFSYMYGNYEGPYNTLLSDMFADSDIPNTDVASWAAAHESAQQTYVAKIMADFKSMREQQK